MLHNNKKQIKGIKVLSLFDGVSCARVALERAGIPVEVYYASEVDKYAMQISAKNYPDIVQVGSVVDIKSEDYKDIGLLVGGSPCTDLSIAKKNRKGLDGERSGLFWEYVRILKEVKPKYFILENVNSMPKEAKAIITETLGVEPIMINAALVSAQNRKRLFWCGQTRERLYFNNVLCYNCLYENSRIQTKSQDKGGTEILGNPQDRCGDLQDMPERISEDKSERDNQDLLGKMSGNQQEAERQKSGQNKEISISERISKDKQAEDIGIPKEISSIRDRQTKNGDSRQASTQIGSKKNEKPLSSGTYGNKKENDERRSNGNTPNEAGVCCVQCGKGLDDRPFNTFIERGDERFTEPTNLMSEMQFNEARQNNGRVFDVYKISITQPEDRGILLKDILEPPAEVDERMVMQRTMVKIGNIGTDAQAHRVYDPQGKSVILSALGGGQGAKTGLYAVALTETRTEEAKKARSEYMKKNGKDYSPRRGKELKPRNDFKANTITTGTTKESLILQDTQIRKLTPVECERLQSLPDNFTEGVSNTQRYKACGNAFNVDVVSWILSFIPR